MQVRGGLVVACVAVLVAVAAALSVAAWQRGLDGRNLQAAVSLAHRLPAPAFATTSRQCHGDGLTACWTTPRTAADVAQALAASMRGLGARPVVQCARMKVGVGPAGTTTDECSVIARFGARAVAAFVGPDWQGSGTAAHLDGSLISVAAA